SSWHPPELRVDAIRPQTHPHVTEQCGSLLEMLARLPLVPRSAVEAPQTEMAARRQRAPAQALGMSHRLPVEILAALHVERLPMRDHFGGQVQRPALEPRLVLLARALDGVVGELSRVTDHAHQPPPPP